MLSDFAEEPCAENKVRCDSLVSDVASVRTTSSRVIIRLDTEFAPTLPLIGMTEYEWAVRGLHAKMETPGHVLSLTHDVSCFVEGVTRVARAYKTHIRAVVSQSLTPKLKTE